MWWSPFNRSEYWYSEKLSKFSLSYKHVAINNVKIQIWWSPKVVLYLLHSTLLGNRNIFYNMQHLLVFPSFLPKRIVAINNRRDYICAKLWEKASPWRDRLNWALKNKWLFIRWKSRTGRPRQVAQHGKRHGLGTLQEIVGVQEGGP